MWLYVNSFHLCVCGYLSGQDYVMECAGVRMVTSSTFHDIVLTRYVPTHAQTERTDIQPHTDTLCDECKSTFQFSNLAKYGHGPPEMVSKETETCRGKF